MIYVGIDLSTKALTLAGVTPDDDWSFATIPIPHARGSIHGRGIRQAMRDNLGPEYWDHVCLAWIERPYYNRLNPNTYATLSQILGATADAIPRHVTVDTISPAAWRAELGMSNLNRAAAKAAARLWCNGHGLPDNLDEHACDAACIAHVAITQSGRHAS